MSVLASGVLLFAIFLLLHIAVWRLWYPRNPIRVLIFLFSAVVLACAISMIFNTSYTISQYLYIMMLFFLFFICYLLTYPAIDADSPSLVIVLRVLQSGKNGLAYESLKRSLGDDLLIEPRLKDLVESRLVDYIGCKYKINRKGKFFVAPFIIYRNFLGLGKGG